MKKCLLVIVSILAVGSLASAKELTNRLGVGIRTNTAVDNLPSLAAVYYPNPDFGLVTSLGIDTKKDNSRFALTGGVRRLVFRESNMNFYMGGNLGLINHEVNGNKDSGFELSAIFGAEFFFSGLDSLGLSFEGGVGVVSTDSTRFRTVAESPVQAGMVFYF